MKRVKRSDIDLISRRVSSERNPAAMEVEQTEERKSSDVSPRKKQQRQRRQVKVKMEEREGILNGGQQQAKSGVMIGEVSKVEEEEEAHEEQEEMEEDGGEEDSDPYGLRRRSSRNSSRDRPTYTEVKRTRRKPSEKSQQPTAQSSDVVKEKGSLVLIVPHVADVQDPGTPWFGFTLGGWKKDRTRAMNVQWLNAVPRCAGSRELHRCFTILKETDAVPIGSILQDVTVEVDQKDLCRKGHVRMAKHIYEECVALVLERRAEDAKDEEERRKINLSLEAEQEAEDDEEEEEGGNGDCASDKGDESASSSSLSDDDLSDCESVVSTEEELSEKELISLEEERGNDDDDDEEEEEEVGEEADEEENEEEEVDDEEEEGADGDITGMDVERKVENDGMKECFEPVATKQTDSLDPKRLNVIKSGEKRARANKRKIRVRPVAEVEVRPKTPPSVFPHVVSRIETPLVWQPFPIQHTSSLSGVKGSVTGKSRSGSISFNNLDFHKDFSNLSQEQYLDASCKERLEAAFSNGNVLDFFDTCFPMAAVDMLVEGTKANCKLKGRSSSRDLYQRSVLYAYLGAQLKMSLFSCGGIRFAFQEGAHWMNQYFESAEDMREVRRFLHVNPSPDDSDVDMNWRIRPLCDLLNQQWARLVTQCKEYAYNTDTRLEDQREQGENRYEEGKENDRESRKGTGIPMVNDKKKEKKTKKKKLTAKTKEEKRLSASIHPGLKNRFGLLVSTRSGFINQIYAQKRRTKDYTPQELLRLPGGSSGIGPRVCVQAVQDQCAPRGGHLGLKSVVVVNEEVVSPHLFLQLKTLHGIHSVGKVKESLIPLLFDRSHPFRGGERNVHQTGSGLYSIQLASPLYSNDKKKSSTSSMEVEEEDKRSERGKEEAVAEEELEEREAITPNVTQYLSTYPGYTIEARHFTASSSTCHEAVYTAGMRSVSSVSEEVSSCDRSTGHQRHVTDAVNRLLWFGCHNAFRLWTMVKKENRSSTSVKSPSYSSLIEFASAIATALVDRVISLREYESLARKKRKRMRKKARRQRQRRREKKLAEMKEAVEENENETESTVKRKASRKGSRVRGLSDDGGGKKNTSRSSSKRKADKVSTEPTNGHVKSGNKTGLTIASKYGRGSVPYRKRLEDPSNHQMVRLPNKQQRNCVLCSINAEMSESKEKEHVIGKCSYVCRTCGDVALCCYRGRTDQKCWSVWHSKKNIH